MRQCEPQRIRGWFYLPEAPDERVPGILTWEPSDGATLELIGGFSPGPDYQPSPEGNGVYATQIVGDVRSGTIFGESDSGKKLSIWDAQRGSYTAGISGEVREEFWSSTWVCVGAHIGSPQDPAFIEATLEPDELYYLTNDRRFCPPQWAKIAGVENPGERLVNGTQLMPYILPVIGGYHAEYAIADIDGARYSVNTHATRPWVSEATEAFPELKLDMMTRNLRRGRAIELQLGANVSIRLQDEAAGSAAAFVDSMAAVLDLIRLATFSTCDVEAIWLEATNGDQLSLLSLIGEPAAPHETHLPAAIVFTFGDVTLDSFLSTRKSLTEGRQAAFAWSMVIGHCGYSPQFVEQYVSQVLAAAEGFDTWCLRNSGQVELNARLKALHGRLPNEVLALIDLDVNNWADWAVWARNHVAHGGTRRRRFIQDSLQLLAIAKSVNLVTYLVVLAELGVPSEKMVDALRNHPRLQGLLLHCEAVNQIKEMPEPPL
ncbi:HEPN domain-containing protein [Nocardia sp. CDC160]|uniref:ApeA N-terminal domain 1-containing protein n=1 Tax=Nocardia sp. CDC160 TaxID=3112166 RepID=UPI002DB589DA|nr:HEPN domain-containing protein [Nocardia sp. CDC160]MEC3915777.1 HEPN domain-containing protein [Nocardia sp. CDC160]